MKQILTQSVRKKCRYHTDTVCLKIVCVNASLFLFIFQDFIWLWSDGSKFDFTAWHTDEPNNAGWAEKCVEMNYGGKYTRRALFETIHSLNETLRFLYQHYRTFDGNLLLKCNM